MNADKIIIYFSIFIVVCVVIWALIMINEFNKVSKN